MKHIQNRMVPDPSMTDSEFYAQKRDNPTKPNIGRVYVQENASTRIGALCFVRRRLGHHERAAEWFKSAYEALYGGLAPAIDAGKVRVDTSIMAHDNGAVARLDQGRALLDLIVGREKVRPILSKDSSDRIIACVVLGMPCSDFADVTPSGQTNKRQLGRAVDKLLDALDIVAEVRGFSMKAA